MLTDQLKVMVMEKIVHEQNEATLQEVLDVLESHNADVLVLSEAQKASVAAGLADWRAGHVVNQEELDKEDEQWR